MNVILLNLGIGQLRDDKLDGYAQDKVDKISANPAFPSPGGFPELELVVEKLAEYRTALAKADDGSKANTAEKNIVRAELEDGLTVLAFKVRELVAGDIPLFLSTGFDIKSEGQPVGLASTPSGLAAKEGPFSGSIALNWDFQQEARSFVVQMSTDISNPTAWTHESVVTRSEFTIVGLTSGTKYWFRVAAINAAGQGPYSDPATKYAP